MVPSRQDECPKPSPCPEPSCKDEDESICYEPSCKEGKNSFSIEPSCGENDEKHHCPGPPKPSCDKVEGACPDCPKNENDPVYNKIPEEKKQELLEVWMTAKRAADDKYEESIQKASVLHAEAQSKHALAESKYGTAKTMLCKRIRNAKDELFPVYNQCIRDSISKNCTSPNDVPKDKKVICKAKLCLGLSQKNFEFQTDMQKLDKEKSTADAEWSKAEQTYKSAICVAHAEKVKACKDATVKFFENLSKALEEAC
ncbi:MAG: hypothetical protein F6K58_20345 [Symploca sp. SIO2E9]|nr:hypothetical protein [Symploca sp. SIO2E9]